VSQRWTHDVCKSIVLNCAACFCYSVAVFCVRSKAGLNLWQAFQPEKQTLVLSTKKVTNITIEPWFVC
jgi:hypothetical protein